MATTKEMRSDSSIREDVLLELKWDPKIKSNDIAVAVKDGVVMLSGFVSSFWELDADEKAAKRVYGVRGVPSTNV
jgi:osmotically-inducible protein OsmY